MNHFTDPAVDYGNPRRPLTARLPAWIPDSWIDQFYFLRYHRRPANLHDPQTWNEKMLWLKQHHRPPIMHRFADKAACRAWIAETVGEQFCVPLLGSYASVDAVPWQLLPQRFVLKAGHGSGWTIVCRDRQQFDAGRAQRLLHRWLREDFSSYAREWHYHGLTPTILLEPLLCEPDGNPARDVKVTCINGEPQIISVHLERYSDRYQLINLDGDWNDLGFAWKVARGMTVPPRPPQLPELLRVARVLSTGMPHLRIDCYLTDGLIRVGEVTVFGERGINTVPDHIDRWIGRLLHLPVTATEA
jgi:hypothetical protein